MESAEISAREIKNKNFRDYLTYRKIPSYPTAGLSEESSEAAH